MKIRVNRYMTANSEYKEFEGENAFEEAVVWARKESTDPDEPYFRRCLMLEVPSEKPMEGYYNWDILAGITNGHFDSELIQEEEVRRIVHYLRTYGRESGDISVQIFLYNLAQDIEALEHYRSEYLDTLPPAPYVGNDSSAAEVKSESKPAPATENGPV